MHKNSFEPDQNFSTIAHKININYLMTEEKQDRKKQNKMQNVNKIYKIREVES